MFAEVAVPVYVRQTFTYRLADEVADAARVGCRVTVPFGKKILTGFIVAVHDKLEDGIDSSDLKSIEELLDDEPMIALDILELTRWMSDYYYAPWGECLRAALPAGATSTSERMIALTDAGRFALQEASRSASNSKVAALELIGGASAVSSRALERQFPKAKAHALIRHLERDGLIRVWQELRDTKLKPRLQNAVRLTGLQIGDSKPLNEKQLRVVQRLQQSAGHVGLSDLLEMENVSSSVVRTLEKRGVVEVFAREVRRDPLSHLDQAQNDFISLTGEQQAALDEITPKIGGGYATFLLHGITGSGKTEIYLKAIRAALELNMSAMMLVPEIALTPIFARRLRNEFGETLALLHSSLSEGERNDEWRRIRAGEARIMIGTRSAVFAPLQKIGLIIVDEEHDTSYKQDETPRYNGRDTAIMRAHQAGAVVVLGSATPSIESYSNAKGGKYIYLRLNNRYAERPLARVETVDMREVFKRHGKQQVFSDKLKKAIEENFERGEQTLVLLNRRGFSSFLLCRSCGLAIQCPNCDVTLTYHRLDASLQCHYCGYIRPVPRVCDACDGQYIHYVGLGTEQLEARLKEMYPRMNIARLDRDTARRRGSLEQIIMEFSTGGIDLLVGTQMIAKGHDFPNVTLVGVVSVDGGLGLPDFRAAERTFQLLTQVAGRAGRGDRPGHVIIQTYHPEHYSIQCAKSQNYEEFYQREIQFRRAMSYPPFTALINILVHDVRLERAAETASALARHLRQTSTERRLRVLGPAAAPLGRLKGEHRIQLLIKAHSRSLAREALDIAMDRTLSDHHNPRSISIEVDPINLM
jgi:primosomal protein N' (replication factor Y)